MHQTDIVNFMPGQNGRKIDAHGFRISILMQRDMQMPPDTVRAGLQATTSNFQLNYSCYFDNDRYGFRRATSAATKRH